jgi:hypothetical protein
MMVQNTSDNNKTYDYTDLWQEALQYQYLQNHCFFLLKKMVNK